MRHIYDMNDRIILGIFVAALIVLTIFCIYVAVILLSSYVDYYESISLKCCVLLDRIDGELCEMIDSNSNICDEDGNISSEYEKLIIEIINNNIPDILVGEPKPYIYDFKIVARKAIIDYIKCGYRRY